MGAYLSEPVTDKESTDEIGDRVLCGASSMQGWRKTQEDAHNCSLDYDKNASLFAVYDGHGGHEVAVYSAQHLPEYLKNCEAYKKGDYTQALKDAFLGFDATLMKPEILTILKQLAKNKNDDNNSGSAEDEEEENVKNLYEEAEMPLEQVMAKYQNDLLNNTNKIKDDGKSPHLRAKRPCSSGASSSRAGTSSSNCSTSQIAETGNGNMDPEEDSSDKKEEDKRASVSSSDGQSTSHSSKQIDCGTSNGDSKPDETVKVDKNVPGSFGNVKVESIEKLEDDKISDKPENVKIKSDKSRDEKISDKPKDIKVRKDKSEDENSLGVEVNGEVGDEGKQGVNGDVTEGEGGKGKEKARISPSLRRRCATALYRSLLESQDNSDSDSDDEGDESFQGAENSSDDDDDEEEEEEEEEEDEDDDGEEAEADDEDGGDEDNGEEEDNMIDDEEDEDDFSMYMSDKPGLDSGCTAVVALLKGQELYVANAGDSRCVVCRKGQAIEMSLDHKPEDDIERTRIVKAGGRITGDGRVNGGLNLSRALGDHAYKQSEGLPAEEQMITALPDVRTLMIDPMEDEFMVLACDGIWNFMSSQEVVDFIRDRMQKGETKLSKICEELFDHCLAPKTFGDGTGCDNMTAVIVQFRPELANNTDSKSIKRAASPTESENSKRPRTEETESV